VSAFTEAVERNLKGVEHLSVGRNHKCDECCVGIADDQRDGNSILEDEGHFSWSACEGCGSEFGGNRYAAHGIIPVLMGANADRRVETMIHMDVCADCLAYIANGQEPETW